MKLAAAQSLCYARTYIRRGDCGQLRHCSVRGSSSRDRCRHFQHRPHRPDRRARGLEISGVRRPDGDQYRLRERGSQRTTTSWHTQRTIVQGGFCADSVGSQGITESWRSPARPSSDAGRRHAERAGTIANGRPERMAYVVDHQRDHLPRPRRPSLHRRAALLRPCNATRVGRQKSSRQGICLGRRASLRRHSERARKAPGQRGVTSRPAPDSMAYLTALLPMKDAVAVTPRSAETPTPSCAPTTLSNAARTRSWPTYSSNGAPARPQRQACPWKSSS